LGENGKTATAEARNKTEAQKKGKLQPQRRRVKRKRRKNLGGWEGGVDTKVVRSVKGWGSRIFVSVFACDEINLIELRGYGINRVGI